MVSFGISDADPMCEQFLADPQQRICGKIKSDIVVIITKGILFAH